MLDSEPTGAGPADAPTNDSPTNDSSTDEGAATRAPRRRRAASRPAGPPSLTDDPAPGAPATAAPASADPAGQVSATGAADAPVAKKTTRKRTSKKAASQPAPTAETAEEAPAQAQAEPEAGGHATAQPSDGETGSAADTAPAAPAKKATRKRASRKAAAAGPAGEDVLPAADALTTDDADPAAGPVASTGPAAIGLLFQPPTAVPAPATAADPGAGADPAAVVPAARTRRRASAKSAAAQQPAASAAGGTGSADPDEPGQAVGDPGPVDPTVEHDARAAEDVEDAEGEDGTARRRRRGGRGRRGRGRGRDAEDGAEGGEETPDSGVSGRTSAGGRDTSGAPDESDSSGSELDTEDAESGDPGDTADDETGTSRRRRRRRRRGGGEDGAEEPGDDPPNTVVRVREPRKSTRSRADRADRSEPDDDGVRSVKGSTRLEAKKQRRREGRDAGRRRPSVITEAEFLARRESVERVMIVRQAGERTQIGVLEDGVLVEHYVSTASSTGLLGNVYLGRVQNVLPSMEAAFVDIGKGRNAVLYAGEVNWDAAGLEGQPRRIELALKSGDPVLVQVTKDPIGSKGARLTSQISLAGRYLVLVPGGSMTGISRKLPETERTRLKAILRKVVPEGSGVIVRTAAEGASEEELSRDVARLTAQWTDIEKKSEKGSSAPTVLYGEPDMTIRVVRDIFNEDFASLLVSGDDAWDMLDAYVSHVAPDLRDRMSRWTSEQDVFGEHRVDEQLAKALDRKVWLPSGGYLIIDRTEAMVVVDVNTGKFTGAGGNLEETVTKNNLEAAEELVRQLRLRDLGGMIVVDFIDMVLESNRDLVLRRMLECLGRDRTKHQVAEVTSLGLVQMTRKRVGQGLHEVFAEACEACRGRGYHIHSLPVEKSAGGNGGGVDRKPTRGARSKPAASGTPGKGPVPRPPTAGPADEEVAAGAAADAAGVPPADDAEQAADVVEAAPRPAADAADVDASPVAVEDPVEPAVKPARRRRKAVSPVTTL